MWHRPYARYNAAELEFRLSETLNETLAGHIDVYVDRYFRYYNDGYRGAAGPYDLTFDELVNALGKTFVHEIGHTLGLNHPFTNDIDIGLPGSQDDLMAQGLDTTGRLSWVVTAQAASIALGLEFVPGDVQQTLDYFWAYRQTREANKSWGDAPNPGEDPDVSPLIPVGDGALAILRADDLSFLSAHDFGAIAVDGPAGQSAQLELVLLNTGDQDLFISDVRLDDNPGHFHLAPHAATNAVLHPLEQLPVTLVYDPLASGLHTATLQVYNDGLGGTYELDLRGFGVQPTGDLVVEVADTNFAGVAQNALPLWKENLVTLRNQGAVSVSVLGIVVGEGSEEFYLSSAAESVRFDRPIVLDPAESFSFDVFFDPKQIGLRRGKIHIFTDDPDQPLTTVTVAGTGLADGRSAAELGNDYVAVRYYAGSTAVVKRYVSDAHGQFPLSVPAGQSYEVFVFDPVSGLIAHNFGQGGDSNSLVKPFFMASSQPDSDGDGLPDDVEFAIGSAGDNTDTNGDGIDDFESLTQGIDPAKPNYAALGSSGSASTAMGVYTSTGEDELPGGLPAGGSLILVPGSNPPYQPPGSDGDDGDTGPLPMGIVNGSFDISDPQNSAFGWKTRGGADVLEGAAVIGENAAYFSRFSQSFVVPAGVTSLRFDILDLQLHTNPGDPPDVFEVALLDRTTKEPLVSTALDLTRTDALLNIQPQAHVFYGAETNVPGVAGSGDIGSSSLPWTVQVDLRGVEPGTEATLFFDLLGFGESRQPHRGGQCRAVQPTAANTRIPSESHRRFRIGRGRLDQRRPGPSRWHDRSVVESRPGSRWGRVRRRSGAWPMKQAALHLATWRWPRASRIVRVRASNEFGVTIVNRNLRLDTQAPAAQLVAPVPGSLVTQDVGYVDLRWVDEGLAGLDVVSLEQHDVTVTGVTVTGVESLGSDIYRYRYAGQLPDGVIVVTAVAEQVSDLAANRNAEHQATFEFHHSTENQPPHVDLNGSDEGINFAATFVEDADPVHVGAGTLTVTDSDTRCLCPPPSRYSMAGKARPNCCRSTRSARVSRPPTSRRPES